MSALPNGFRQLEGAELLRAEAARERYMKGLAPEFKDGRTVGVNDLSRIIEPSNSIETEGGHLESMRDAAAAVGDSKAWIVSDATGTLDVVGLEVELAALCKFVSETDFAAGDEWIPEAMQSWPEAAAKAAYPEFAQSWTLLSPTGAWGYLSTDSDDFTALSGDAAFIRAYRQSRPEAAFDVIFWLHRGGSWLIEEPRLKWNWFRRRVPSGPPAQTAFLRRYMESFYGRADADWLWNLYVETFTEGYGQRIFQSWKKFEDELLGRIRSDPATEARLQSIWDASGSR